MIRVLLFCTLLAGASFSSPADARAQAQERVVIVADQEAGAVRFVIDGEEVARLDASGLHVRESVSYGGVLTDYGASGFVAHVSRHRAGPDDEE